MKIDNVIAAIAEAERFLKRARLVRNEAGKNTIFAMNGANAAACKRASLDLTRALAKMRMS